MKKLLLILSLPRTLIAYILARRTKIDEIFQDLNRFAYGGKKHDKEYLTFSEVIVFDKCFRNVLEFRLKKGHMLSAVILRVLFPVKRIWRLEDVMLVEDSCVSMGMGR